MRQRRQTGTARMDKDKGLGSADGSATLTHRPRAVPSSASKDTAAVNPNPSDGASKNFVPHRRIKQPDGSISQPHTHYVLPFLRIKSMKSAVLALIGVCTLFLSISTVFMAHSIHKLSRHNPSSGMILPSAKEWGAGRESRKKKREQRAAAEQIEHLPTGNSSRRSKLIREWKEEVIIPVKSQMYEAHLSSFYTKLAEGGSAHQLSFDHQDSLGQDMRIYSDIGCSTFNKLFHTKGNSTSEDAIRRFWQSHHASILDASRLGDMSFAHKNWTLTLLKSLSPFTLLDSLPTSNTINPQDVERIIGIIVRRLLGLTHVKYGAALLPPPLRIAIFGGPTVAGQGCHRGRGISRASTQTNPAFCAFPYRLEQFLNWMLLPPSVLKHISGIGNGAATIPIVEVVNLGEEGTYSDYSEAIARNRMYPPEKSPDVVIHAYGIEDYGRGISHIEPFYAAVHNSFQRKLKDGCREEDQKPPPVILRALLETNGTSIDLAVTAVLGDVIDDVEEGETYLPELNDGTASSNVVGGAFGMAGHAATSWALAFDLAHIVLNYCKSKANTNHVSQVTITKQKQHQEHQYQCDNGIHPQCIFSILSGSKGNVAKPSLLLQSLTPFVVENTGWSPSSDMTAGFSRKTGIVATTQGATMTLLFRNITRPVRRFDVITLRSTSKLWRDGAAEFSLVTGGDFSHDGEAAEASVADSKETSFEISAELIADREDDTHVTYHFGIDLVEGENGAAAGSDVLLKISLTKGDKFKILGLMLCE